MTEAVHLPNATPFDLIAEDAQSWIDEARHWADGKPVETQDQADAVSAIIEALRQSAKAADEQRKDENKPHDDAKVAVQAKYAPLFADPKTKAPGKVYAATDALKACLLPYLQEQDRIKREAEDKARQEAEEAQRVAQEAMQAAQASDLAAREAAEALAERAEVAQADAKAASKDKAHALGGSRAMGLRTKWTAKVTDYRLAARHFWQTNPEAFNAVIEKLAADDAREGRRSPIPGVEFVEEKVL